MLCPATVKAQPTGRFASGRHPGQARSTRLADVDRCDFGAASCSLDESECLTSGSADAVASDDADELLDVVSTHGEDRPSPLGELGETELVALLAAVVELVLNQRAELGVCALGSVAGVDGDQEVGDRTEPGFNLALGAGLGPFPHCARRAGLGLADDAVLVSAVGYVRPEEADVRGAKVSVVLVQEGRLILDEGGPGPFEKIGRRGEQDERRSEQLDWRLGSLQAHRQASRQSRANRRAAVRRGAPMVIQKNAASPSV